MKMLMKIMLLTMMIRIQKIICPERVTTLKGIIVTEKKRF